MMWIRRLSTFVALFLALGALAGCSGEPSDAAGGARAALEAAEAAGAPEYAPAAWRAASDALQQAESELAAQGSRFALLRRYGKAEELFQEAERLAERARSEAGEAATRGRDDAEALLLALRQQLEDSQAMLDSEKGQSLLTTPRAGAALEGLARENRELTEVLPRITRAIEEGRYSDALQIGEAARDQAMTIQSEIYETLETGRPPRRSK